MLAARRSYRFGLVRRFMGLPALLPVGILLLANLFALPKASLAGEQEAVGPSAPATQTNEGQPAEGAATEGEPKSHASSDDRAGSETLLGTPANTDPHAAGRADSVPQPPTRLPTRSSRRSAAGLDKTPGSAGSQLQAEPAAQARKRGAWVSVARSASQEEDACRCPRCGHALAPASASSSAVEEVPVVSNLGGLLRGLLRLGHDIASGKEPLSPNEPAAVLWEVKQRLGSDPLAGTIFSEPGFSSAAEDIGDGDQDEDAANFVQRIRSLHSMSASKKQTPSHDALYSAEGDNLFASGVEEGVTDNVEAKAPARDSDSDSTHSGPPDLVDQPDTEHANGEVPEEVRGIETLPLPHSNEDLVECLRESSRQLEIIAHDLERHRFYDLADDLRYMAADLRQEARRRERSEPFAPDGAPAQPIGGEPTTTAQARLRTELLELRSEVARLRELLLRSVKERGEKRR